MKIQLNTTRKTIKIEESINLNELYETLESLLPEGKWKEFELLIENIFNWKEPINIPYIPPFPNQPDTILPWWEAPYKITCDLNPGLYNINYDNGPKNTN
jgi:hypothetical protein